MMQPQHQRCSRVKYLPRKTLPGQTADRCIGEKLSVMLRYSANPHRQEHAKYGVIGAGWERRTEKLSRNIDDTPRTRSPNSESVLAALKGDAWHVLGWLVLEHAMDAGQDMYEMTPAQSHNRQRLAYSAWT